MLDGNCTCEDTSPCFPVYVFLSGERYNLKYIYFAVLFERFSDILSIKTVLRKKAQFKFFRFEFYQRFCLFSLNLHM